MTACRSCARSRAGCAFRKDRWRCPTAPCWWWRSRRARLTRVAPDGAQAPSSQHTGGPNGAAIGPDGKVYVCNNGGFNWHECPDGLRPTGQADDYSGGRIERVDLATGKVETLYTQCDGHPLRGPNDLVFDAHGGFYFTDLGKTRAREMDRGARLLRQGRRQPRSRRSPIPPSHANGCGLSPDGRTLYFAETESARLWAMDILAPGEVQARAVALVARRPPRRLPRRLPALRQHGGRRRRQHLRRHADQRRHHRLQPRRRDGATTSRCRTCYTTNICFGGPDLRTAYVTLSGSGRLVAFEWERPGLRLNYQ